MRDLIFHGVINKLSRFQKHDLLIDFRVFERLDWIFSGVYSAEEQKEVIAEAKALQRQWCGNVRRHDESKARRDKGNHHKARPGRRLKDVKSEQGVMWKKLAQGAATRKTVEALQKEAAQKLLDTAQAGEQNLWDARKTAELEFQEAKLKIRRASGILAGHLLQRDTTPSQVEEAQQYQEHQVELRRQRCNQAAKKESILCRKTPLELVVPVGARVFFQDGVAQNSINEQSIARMVSQRNLLRSLDNNSSNFFVVKFPARLPLALNFTVILRGAVAMDLKHFLSNGHHT